MKSLLFLAFIFGYASTASADRLTDVVKIVCSPELANIEVEQTVVRGRKAEESFEKDPKGIFEKYGLIALYNLIKNPSTPDVSFTGFTTSCEIGGSTYTIIIAPYSRPSYYCGGFLTFYLTIKKNDEIIVDNLLFGSCEDKWELRNLRMTELDDEEAYNEGFYTFGGDVMDQNFGRLIWRNEMPVLKGSYVLEEINKKIEKIKAKEKESEKPEKISEEDEKFLKEVFEKLRELQKKTTGSENLM